MIISTKDQYVALEAKGPRGGHHSRVIPFEAILNARAGTKWYLGFEETPNFSSTKEMLAIARNNRDGRVEMYFNRWEYDEKGAATQEGFFFFLKVREGCVFFEF